jgi:uncharacterized protein YcbK (DUF882 family)|tara:strand:- start:312 stop:734 length:423 start_codon:yes stop_codon:yes gene_type:complete
MRYVEQTWPSERWPNFSFNEAKCSATGKCIVDDGFMDQLQELRRRYGKPMTVSSLYRDVEHPIEAAKGDKPGAHVTGKAVDIVVSHADAFYVLKHAMTMGVFKGVGIKQGGNGRFIHLDVLANEEVIWIPRPRLWSYKIK